MKKREYAKRVCSAVLGVIAAVSVVVPIGNVSYRAGGNAVVWDTKNTGLVFETDFDGNCTIVGYSKDVTELSIPSELNGRKVIGIDALYYLPLDSDSFESKPEDGFYSYDGGIFLDPEKQTFGSLTKITLPDSITYVDTEGISEEVIQNSKETADGVQYLDNLAIGFDNLNKDGKAVIKDGTTAVNRGAFENCTGLTEIELPSSLKIIQYEAFKGCEKLRKVIFSEGLTEIRASAFSGCTALEEVSLPVSVTIINDGAFEECTGLKKVYIPGDITEFSQTVFSWCDTKKLVLVTDSAEVIKVADIYHLTVEAPEGSSKQTVSEDTDSSQKTDEGSAQSAIVSESSAEASDGKNTMPFVWGGIGGIAVIGILAVVFVAIKKKKKTGSEKK